MKELNFNNRFTALDIFRGLTVCFMIIVNSPGNGEVSFWFLKHAAWNGFTPTDLVFPSFLFAVGNALSFNLKKWAVTKPTEVVYKILKRTVLLFAIGYLMYWFPFFTLNSNGHLELLPIAQTRIMGVLQRIGLCYGIVALMVYYLGTKRTLIVGISLLFAYWLILFLFGMPGADLSDTSSVLHRFDTWLLGTNHLYYRQFGFDPEGVLSTLPALFNVIAGLAVGSYLQKRGKNYETITKLLLVGIALLFAAYVWEPLFPANKNIWSSTYALLTVGLDCLLLAIIIYFTEMKSCTRGTFVFLVTGRNPLFIYLLSEVGLVIMSKIMIGNESVSSWLYLHVFSLTGNYLGSFLFALWWMFTCWVVALLLDRKKIYIKL